MPQDPKGVTLGGAIDNGFKFQTTNAVPIDKGSERRSLVPVIGLLFKVLKFSAYTLLVQTLGSAALPSPFLPSIS